LVGSTDGGEEVNDPLLEFIKGFTPYDYQLHDVGTIIGLVKLDESLEGRREEEEEEEEDGGDH